MGKALQVLPSLKFRFSTPVMYGPQENHGFLKPNSNNDHYILTVFIQGIVTSYQNMGYIFPPHNVGMLAMSY